MKQVQLPMFPKLERRRPIKRMHVTDAGQGNGVGQGNWLQFTCLHCQHVEEGFYDQTMTVSKAKRGIACPRCNVQ